MFNYLRAKWAALSRLPGDNYPAACGTEPTLLLFTNPSLLTGNITEVDKLSQEYRMLEANEAGLPSETINLKVLHLGISPRSRY